MVPTKCYILKRPILVFHHCCNFLCKPNCLSSFVVHFRHYYQPTIHLHSSSFIHTEAKNKLDKRKQTWVNQQFGFSGMPIRLT